MENKDIQVKSFHVISLGDLSAGIFRSEWCIPGPFWFNDGEDLELFRAKLKEAWEYVADDAYIETFEEIAEREYKIRKSMNYE